MDVVGTWRAERVTCRRWGPSSSSCAHTLAHAFAHAVCMLLQLSPSRPWRPLAFAGGSPCGPAPLARPKLPTVRWAHLPDATVQCQCAMLPIEARWTSANSTEPEDSQTRSTALLNSGHICRGYIAVKNRYCNCFSWCNKEGWLHTAQDVMAHGSISCR